MMYVGYSIAISATLAVAAFFIVTGVLAISESIIKSFRETKAGCEFLYKWQTRNQGKILSKKASKLKE